MCCWRTAPTVMSEASLVMLVVASGWGGPRGSIGEGFFNRREGCGSFLGPSVSLLSRGRIPVLSTWSPRN